MYTLIVQYESGTLLEKKGFSTYERAEVAADKELKDPYIISVDIVNDKTGKVVTTIM